jgi:sporulation protein YlmC with PRC-barrel domain
MRLEIGGRVDCSDGTFGEFADVVIDPTTKRVTHLVVKAEGQPSVERLVPIELADRGDGTRRVVTLRATAKEVGSLPPVQEVAYVQLGDFPLDDPDWDVGIKEVYALPYYPAYDVEPGPLDVSIMYDRIPNGGVEIRRASDVYSAERHHLGHVDGLIVDRDEHITHLVLQRGHLWGRREVTIPIGAVAKVETDDVTLSLTKDRVGSLPEVAVRRWPTSSGKARDAAAGREQPVQIRGAGTTTEEAHDE